MTFLDPIGWRSDLEKLDRVIDDMAADMKTKVRDKFESLKAVAISAISQATSPPQEVQKPTKPPEPKSAQD